jgi:hypothetical protein
MELEQVKMCVDETGGPPGFFAIIMVIIEGDKEFDKISEKISNLKTDILHDQFLSDLSSMQNFKRDGFHFSADHIDRQSSN